MPSARSAVAVVVIPSSGGEVFFIVINGPFKLAVHLETSFFRHLPTFFVGFDFLAFRA